MDNHLECVEFHLKGYACMDYCNKVKSFVNYVLSNPKNNSGCGIKYSCKRCKNKKFTKLSFEPYMNNASSSSFWYKITMVCSLTRPRVSLFHAH